MQTVGLGKSELKSSRLVYGCMRITGDKTPEGRQKGLRALEAAVESGYRHFDHADIYDGGECESLFGEFLQASPGLRRDLIITSKCGIRFAGQPEPDDPQRYDFSYQYIVNSVEGSLDRLGVDYLDLLLLHRPDYLFNAAEVATALESLMENGMVRHCGVSNFSPSQVRLLQSQCRAPLLVNQVEINIHKIDALLDGTLDQCQQKRITPMAWCPLGGVVYPAWGNTFTETDEARIRAEFERQSKRYETEAWLIMLAWLLEHPAGIVPIIGSTTASRIAAAVQALGIDYSREDWYRLLEARNGAPVP